MQLNPQVTLQPFDKWVINFIGPINPLVWRSSVRYIFIRMDYLKRWVEVVALKYCNVEMETYFLFENVVTRFGFQMILMSNQGMHFLNKIIKTLVEYFKIYHYKCTPYHPHANGKM